MPPRDENTAAHAQSPWPVLPCCRRSSPPRLRRFNFTSIIALSFGSGGQNAGGTTAQFPHLLPRPALTPRGGIGFEAAAGNRLGGGNRETACVPQEVLEISYRFDALRRLGVLDPGLVVHAP